MGIEANSMGSLSPTRDGINQSGGETSIAFLLLQSHSGDMRYITSIDPTAIVFTNSHFVRKRLLGTQDVKGCQSLMPGGHDMQLKHLC